MKTKTLAIAFMLFVASANVLAETYSNNILTLEVPAGFEGPITASPGPDTEVVAYTKPHAAIEGGTLFQISMHDFRSSLAGMPEEERGNASEYYLGQFIGGIGRRRTEFSTSILERIQLGGLPASRITWTGKINGLSVSGVMYCVVIGTTVVSLHTQDVDNAPAENRRAAMDAFEALMVKE